MFCSGKGTGMNSHTPVTSADGTLSGKAGGRSEARVIPASRTAGSMIETRAQSPFAMTLPPLRPKLFLKPRRYKQN